MDLNPIIGCNPSYKGILSAWNSIDNYLIEVDSTLCSNTCPCNFDKITSMNYIRNIQAVPYYNLWWKSFSSSGAQNINGCTIAIKNQIYGSYLTYNNFTFNQDLFTEYYSRIEQTFNCTGFCTTLYYNQNTGTNMKMYKYLFSDIQR